MREAIYRLLEIRLDIPRFWRGPETLPSRKSEKI
jgi:hypothetical protein